MSLAKEAFATTVVLDDSGKKVLMLLRQDFRMWTLPGGGVEPGETTEQAAIRETREETGYQVAVDRLVGTYRRPRMGDVRYVYRAHVTGGQARGSGPETAAVDWVPVDDLPRRMTPFLRQIIEDGVAESGQPFERVQPISFWSALLIRLLVAGRDVVNWVKRRPPS
jgi:8-oxo-dGTP diphosphatase